MPFTPFHFGPGLLIKSLLSRWFSFRVFFLAQIVIDLETLVRLFNGMRPVHGLLHSFFGSTIAAGITILLVKPVFRAASGVHQMFEVVRREEPAFTPPAFFVVCVTALIGAWSHVVLDSVMHRDVAPFHPFSQDNPFLDRLSLTTLHQGCVLAGVVGLIFCFARKLVRST